MRADADRHAPEMLADLVMMGPPYHAQKVDWVFWKEAH